MAQTAPHIPRGLLSKIRATRSSPGDVRSRGARLSKAPPLWRELLLIALFYSAYTLVRLVLNRGGTSGAFEHAEQILGLERLLGIDVEVDLNQALLGVPWLAKAANYFYASAHFLITLGVLVWLYRRRPAHYRWLRTALIFATALALVGYWLYPLAPPRFLPQEGFVDPVTALRSLGLYSSSASGALTNQYAAMPSMHAGWALWCGFIFVRYTRWRWARALGVLYPATTLLVILSTANHYIVDAVVGAGLIAGALTGSWLLYRRRPLRSRLHRCVTTPAAVAGAIGRADGGPAEPDARATRRCPAGATGVTEGRNGVAVNDSPGVNSAREAHV